LNILHVFGVRLQKRLFLKFMSRKNQQCMQFFARIADSMIVRLMFVSIITHDVCIQHSSSLNAL